MIEHGRYLQRYPTTGNWLTMEMDGLYHVGALLPFVKEAKDWRDFASTRLLKELDAQVYPDGAQIELTPGYHNVALSSLFLGFEAGPFGYGHQRWIWIWRRELWRRATPEPISALCLSATRV